MLGPIVRATTRDGGLLQVGVRYYVHSILRSPHKMLTLTEFAGTLPSWLDGKPIAIWRLVDETGRSYYCEAWQLSRIHRDKLFPIVNHKSD